MLFNSLTFLVFFAVVYSLFWLFPGWTGRKRLLLVSSYLFYAAWNPPYVFLLLASTSLDWWLARRISRTDHVRRRRALLILSVLGNLALLGYFKYGKFLLLNFTAALAALGVHYSPPAPDIVLPIGISFYTFASLSYTIDVYRREVAADWKFADYALFVSFFPHLVAGPIVRANRLLPQIAAPRDPTASQVGWGICLFCMGLFGKVVMADYVFAPMVDTVYADVGRYGAGDVWTAVLSFSGQIYYDFAGYSLCAIGLALCFGFVFPDNFRYPYAASGFSDFWRRWHISLSTWLRDYLYIGMGGNQHGAWVTYRNLLLTMLIGGLWHGASWMFVLWGGLHGLYLAIERAMRGVSPAGSGRHDSADWPGTLLVFLVIMLTWIPFRAATPAVALDVLRGLFAFTRPNVLYPSTTMAQLLGIFATLGWHYAQRDVSLESRFGQLRGVAQTAVIAGCLIAVFICSGGEQRAFIYFQF